MRGTRSLITGQRHTTRTTTTRASASIPRAPLCATRRWESRRSESSSAAQATASRSQPTRFSAPAPRSCGAFQPPNWPVSIMTPISSRLARGSTPWTRRFSTSIPSSRRRSASRRGTNAASRSLPNTRRPGSSPAARSTSASMPEGHSVHRIARQFALHFVGKRIAASSPQGRFAAGAAELDGHVMTDAKAVGKQMFLEFDNGLWLRVHLGMYGAWDFAGDFTADAAGASTNVATGASSGTGDSRGEDSLTSMGAPRVARLRMSEQETAAPGADVFPPEPIGAVRVRLLTDNTVADLRGPTACEVITPDRVDRKSVV